MRIVAYVILIASMVLASSSAIAETVNGKSTGRTKITACTNAKHDATRLCESLKVSSFKQCECEQVEISNGDKFECSVDAVCEVGKRNDDALQSNPEDGGGSEVSNVRVKDA